MSLTDSQVVDLVIDAAYNEPENNPSRHRLAERNGVSDDDVRRVVNNDNWNRIRHIVLEEMVKQRLAQREYQELHSSPIESEPDAEPEPEPEKPTNGRRKQPESE